MRIGPLTQARTAYPSGGNTPLIHALPSSKLSPFTAHFLYFQLLLLQIRRSTQLTAHESASMVSHWKSFNKQVVLKALSFGYP